MKSMVFTNYTHNFFFGNESKFWFYDLKRTYYNIINKKTTLKVDEFKNEFKFVFKRIKNVNDLVSKLSLLY